LINFEDNKPIFIQIAETIEDGILSMAFKEEEKLPSVAEFSTTYKINPATANKGINILVDKEIIYKQRGIGMFVSKGARKMLIQIRQEKFYETFIDELVSEAKKIDISEKELINMISKRIDESNKNKK